MSRNKKVASHEKHPLLDETCRSYMESAINSYHLIAADLFAHMGFLLFWFNHIIAEATPENSMCSTFNYFIGENTSNIPNTHSKTYAEEYFKKILKHYNNLCDRNEKEKKCIEGKLIFEWIRGFQSKKPKNYIKTENIDWLPVLKTKDKWSKNYYLFYCFAAVRQCCPWKWNVAKLNFIWIMISYTIALRICRAIR